MGRHVDFANGLEKQGIDLEEVIKRCKKELILDYSWICKVKTDKSYYPIRRSEKKRNFITLYVDSENIGRVYIDKGYTDEYYVKNILNEAYKSLTAKIKIPKNIQIKAYYLKYHEGFEKYLGKL